MKISRILAVGVGLALASPASALAGKEDNSLVWATDREVSIIDNYYQNIRETVVMQWHVWDSLLFRDPETFKYQPLLATGYEWIDNTTIEFDLREGVTFHDGSEFNADDVVYTFNHVSNPENAVVTQANVEWIDHAEKLDPYKVRIKLKEPFPAALEYFATALHIVPDGHYDDAPEVTGSDGAAAKDYGSVAPIGTGPYKLEELEAGKRITLVRNEDYFEGSPKGQPQIDKLVFRTIPSLETRIAELMTGGIDWLWDVPKDQAEHLSDVPTVEVVNAPTMRISYLQFDAVGKSGETPVTDPLVRQAISYAIDRPAIVENLVGGSSEVIHAACFPTQFGCTEDLKKYEYDPEKAKELLAEAGYPDGFSIDIYAYRQREFTEAVINYLSQIGIDANLKYMQYKALAQLVWDSGTPINQMTWGSSSINDVSAITSHFFSGGRDDLAQDEEVIAWLNEADNSVDAEKREALYGKALQKIAEEAYWLPMFTYTKNYAFDADLDFTPTPDEVPYFFNASWQ